MVLTAVRGAIGFLSRIPVGGTEASWDAFRETPVTFPLVGYLIGALVALVFLVPLPAATIAFLYIVAIYLVTGITHLDGVADMGDAVVAHGEQVNRREIMRETAVGTGGVLAVTLVIVGLVTAAIVLASLPQRAVLLVVTAEVGVKVGMVLVLCFGTATHDGLGASISSKLSPRAAVPALLVGAPAALLLWPLITPGVVTFLAACLTALGILHLARLQLGGISGDVVGATNEFGRVIALHAGVIAWMLS